jgi:pimeloyl-ACP methyl ester carboxylesterase
MATLSRRGVMAGLAGVVATSSAAFAQAPKSVPQASTSVPQAPTSVPQAPGDVAPGSITYEDIPYPYPVQFLPLTLYGQDVRMAYMDIPPAGAANGRVVVLLHGMNFGGFYFAGPIEALRKEGFRLVVPDQIGFGRSSKPIIPYNFHDMAANTRKLLASLGVAKAAIVGHSMGGMLAARFSASHPDLTERAVLCNAIGLTDVRWQTSWSSGVRCGNRRARNSHSFGWSGRGDLNARPPAQALLTAGLPPIPEAKTEQDGRSVVKALQVALKEYRLELNDEKTGVHKLPDGLFRSWVSEYHAANPLPNAYYGFKRFKETYLAVVAIPANGTQS